MCWFPAFESVLQTQDLILWPLDNQRNRGKNLHLIRLSRKERQLLWAKISTIHSWLMSILGLWKQAALNYCLSTMGSDSYNRLSVSFHKESEISSIVSMFVRLHFNYIIISHNLSQPTCQSREFWVITIINLYIWMVLNIDLRNLIFSDDQSSTIPWISLW